MANISIFTISDLHLSFSVNKSMVVFRGWEEYTLRLQQHWSRLVKPEDTVVLPGDFSWGLKLPEALEDFKFLESLPGQKILLKGNHDLWWSTVSKVHAFFEENNLKTIRLLFNNAIAVGPYTVCGTRGWMYDQSCDSKLRLREAGRLKLSLAAAEQLGGQKLVFMHYPPAYGEFVCEEVLSLLKEYRVQTVYYGHIHGAGHAATVASAQGIALRLVSADTLNFCPLQITP